MERKKPKENEVLNADNALTLAGLATNKLPGIVGNPAGLAIDLVCADRELEKTIRQASEMMGEDTRHLKASSPAFKKYVKDELTGIYEDRAIGYGFAIAGGAAAVAVAAAMMGPPGWIAGIIIGMVGTMGAGYIKEMIFPSTYNTFLEFAANMQDSGQRKQMVPEEAFVALSLNLDEKTMGQVFRSVGVEDKRSFIRLLKTDIGREKLRMAMLDNDASLRAANGAMTALPGPTLSEQFASLVNDGQISGVDLLNQEKTGHLGVLISMSETQMIQQQMMARQQAPSQAQAMGANPNQQLPQRGANAEVARD